MVEITEITDKLIGKKISCIINGIIIKEGVIVKDFHKYYILQDKKFGSCPSYLIRDKYNYKGYWGIATGSESDLNITNVKNIKLLNTSRIYEVW
jgi:hypothetical protein